ncbi:Acidic mammalian chitinase [Nymphon striatum]|nr:Acidic mammalian chitinase [Nymphon striatum]
MCELSENCHLPSMNNIAKSYRRVCYYRISSRLKPQDINTQICTHINLASVEVSNCSIVPHQPQDAAGYYGLAKLKQKNPNLKVIFSVSDRKRVGGLHYAASSQQNRTRFINQAISFTKKYNFDGLDFDWEFPTGKNKALFLLLLKDFRQTLTKRKSNLIISAAVSGGTSIYNVPLMAKYLDFINVMTYDYNSFLSRLRTAYNSPLYAETLETGSERTRNSNFSMHSWIKGGAPSTKLNMGMPTYGRGFILASENDHGYNAPAVNDAGTPEYPVICKFLKNGGHRVFDNSSKVPYAYGMKKWISFDDMESVTYKSKYIKAMNLGGSMIWVLDSDDWAGNGDAKKKSYRRICYFRAGALKAEAIPVDLCTHINFAFLSIRNIQLTPYQPRDVNIYKELTKLKQAQPSLKLLFSIGGWGNCNGFHEAVVNSDNRKKFINQAISFTKKHNFDGLDFDWEFPNGKDKALFLLLLQEFRQALTQRKSNLILSAAVSSSSYIYNIPLMAKYLDFINVMTYDFNSFWSRRRTAYNSPLYAETLETGSERTRNSNFSMHSWLNGAAASTQLNMGMPTYGRGFILANESNHGYNAPAVNQAGTPRYAEICKFLKNGGHRVFDNSSKVPYAYGMKKWISFDDMESVTYKSKYIKEMKFGGSMVWVLDSDDWAGSCGQGKFPIHTAIWKILK